MSVMKRFAQLLQRRTLWEIVAVYLGTGWALLQAADMFISRLGFPTWLFGATALLLVMGLPIIIATAVLQQRERNASTKAAVTEHAAHTLFTWRNALLGGLIAFAGLGLAGVGSRAFHAVTGKEAEWARTTGVSELKRYIEENRLDSAWIIGARVDAALPSDTMLLALHKRYTARISLHSEPAGAVVESRLYDNPDTTWQRLGVTPLDSVTVPSHPIQIRITKQGFEPVRRVVWLGAGTTSARPIVATLRTVGAPGNEMSLVRGGDVAMQAPGLEGLPAIELADFEMDKYEVTNDQYKKFVDAGSYAKKELWTELGAEAERKIATFVDKTGRPGPSTWEGGSYTDGMADHPVAGVSWYEAVAYARFVGKSLPTIYHWNRAASTALGSFVMPRSNFESKGTRAVTASHAMSTFGTFDMGGNVREWCSNQSGTNRYIMGGGWSDLPYMFNDAYSQAPDDRSDINGIRLVKYRDMNNVALAGAPVTKPQRDFDKEKPASDAVFAAYRQMFAYDAFPLDTKVELVDSTSPDYVREKVSFTAAYGNERVLAWIYKPRNARPPYQALTYFPGSDAIFATSSANLKGFIIDFVTRSGRVFVYPIIKSTYERGDSLQTDQPEMTVAYRDHIIMWGKDIRRTVDYLASRGDIDMERVGYFGSSWGGRNGAIMVAIEPRIKLAILYVAGLKFQRSLPEADGFNYAGRVKVPVLMVNGKYDHFFPYQTSQLPLFNHLGTDPAHKKQVVYDGGHSVPRPQLIRESLDWLDRYFGKVKAP